MRPLSDTSLGRDRFRSPLLSASRLLLSRRATEMFHFAHFPPGSRLVTRLSTTPGFPIRAPTDHRPHGGSPRLSGPCARPSSAFSTWASPRSTCLRATRTRAPTAPSVPGRPVSGRRDIAHLCQNTLPLLRRPMGARPTTSGSLMVGPSPTKKRPRRAAAIHTYREALDGSHPPNPGELLHRYRQYNPFAAHGV